jgi:homoserine kinase
MSAVLVRAFAPASIGNFAVGFDILGAALRPVDGTPLGDTIEAAFARTSSLTCEGPFAHQLPEDPRDNLVAAACEAFAKAWDRALPPLALRLVKGLPVGSGLGSSAATIAATLRALDRLFGHPLTEADLLRAAGEAESQASGAVHLDNVAPALLGGLRLITPEGGAEALPFPSHLRLVLASPELRLETRHAREALPGSIPLSLAVAHAQQLGAFLHALHMGDEPALRRSFKDLLAEPARARLVPGFRAVQAAALQHGAWACTFSGAGPALFAAAEEADCRAIAGAMREAWACQGIASTTRTCGLDAEGARVLEAAA